MTTLHYWAGRGRGEQVRLLLHFVGATYVEDALDVPKFQALKAAGLADFGFVPVLSEEGEGPAFHLSQGPVIMSYLAHKHKLLEGLDLRAIAKLDSICTSAEVSKNQSLLEMFHIFADNCNRIFVLGISNASTSHWTRLHLR
jgi:glutathione S-transferase